MSDSYGDYNTRTFRLSSNFVVPANSYAEVDSVDTTGFVVIKDFYDAGETITFVATKNSIVQLFENNV